jgi:hypothetical protein
MKDSMSTYPWIVFDCTKTTGHALALCRTERSAMAACHRIGPKADYCSAEEWERTEMSG